MTTSIDLSQLSAPDVVDELSFTVIRDAMLADLAVRDPNLSNLPTSDPSYKVLEVAAYRELLLRQRVNDASVAVMLAYATGSDLDNLGALPWMNTPRLVVDPGDENAIPPIEPTYETNDDYRARLQLALEGFSTAGPEGAYLFHAKSASGLVKDVSATRLKENSTATGGAVNALDDTGQAWPVDERVDWKIEITAGTGAGQVRTVGANTATQLTPTVDWVTAPDATSVYELSLGGSVVITVLSTVGDGTPDAALLTVVNDALSELDIRPLTDNVSVQAPTITNYSVTAELTVYPGPDSETVRAASEAAVTLYAEEQHKLGRDITLAGLTGALMVVGVMDLNLVLPAANIVNDKTQVSYVNVITVTVAGVDE